MKQNKLNLLFVSIAFPPKSDPECLQTAKYFKYLSKDKTLNIDVVTSPDKTLFMPIDKDLFKYAKGYRQIIKVPFFENKYVNFLMRKIDEDSLSYPDSKYRFFKKYKWVLGRLKQKPDVIYSRSFPISSALMAYSLQKELKVPWVLHLSDPWSINPIHKLGKAQKWNEDMEIKCFENASVISCTSQKTVELYQEKYPQFRAKMKFYPNVFDMDDKKENPHKFQDKLKVVYTGGLVGDRTPEYIFEVIKELTEKNSDILSDYEFIFAGALDRKNRAFFEQKIPSVKHLGELSFQEALDLQKSADLLLVIDTPLKNKDEALFFPSKLLDYMLVQRKVFALTDRNSSTWEFVEGKIGRCFEHQDISAMVDFLIQTWNRWQEKDHKYFQQSYIDDTYSASFNAQRLSELFYKLK